MRNRKCRTIREVTSMTNRGYDWHSECDRVTLGPETAIKILTAVKNKIGKRRDKIKWVWQEVK